MAVDEHLEVLGPGQLLRGVAAKTAAFVPGAVGSAGVRASLRQTACPVWVHQPERLDSERIAHDGTNEPVASIFLVSQAVAVLDSYFPAGDRSFPWPNDVRDADIVSKYLSAPAVVIARDPQYFHAGVLELRERRQCAKASSRNHGLPLEPEVEQVAIDDERSRLTGEPTEKGDERALRLRAGNSEVGVGYDVAGAVEHGTS